MKKKYCGICRVWTDYSRMANDEVCIECNEQGLAARAEVERRRARLAERGCFVAARPQFSKCLILMTQQSDIVIDREGIRKALDNVGLSHIDFVVLTGLNVATVLDVDGQQEQPQIPGYDDEKNSHDGVN